MEERYLLQAMPILLLATLFVWLTPRTCGQAASTPRTCYHSKKRLHGDSDRTDTGVRRRLRVVKLGLQWRVAYCGCRYQWFTSWDAEQHGP